MTAWERVMSGARRWAAAVLVVAGVVVVVENRGDFPAAWHALRGADAWWLVVLALLVAVSLIDLGARQVVSQRALQLDPRWESMLPAAWAAHFVNTVSKTGGLAGLGVLSAEGRRSGKPRAPVVAAGLLTVVLDQLAFAVVVPFAIVALFLRGHFEATDGVATVLFVGYVGITVAVVVAATRDRRAVRSLFALPGRAAAWFRRVVLRRPARHEPDHTRADELFDAISVVKARPSAALPAALAAVAVDILAILELWVALLAVGVHTDFTVPFVAYSVATLFAIVGIVPGGIGVVELSLAAVLHSFGIPLVVAGTAVVLFRVAEFWIPLAVGAVASHRYALRPTAEVS